MNKLIFIGVGILILAVGVIIGRFTAPKIDVLQVEREEKEILSQSMYVHSDSCAQDYQDGLQMNMEIKDPFLKKKFMLRERYITEADFVYDKEIWMENCMWQKAIYNRYGLGIE